MSCATIIDNKRIENVSRLRLLTRMQCYRVQMRRRPVKERTNFVYRLFYESLSSSLIYFCREYIRNSKPRTNIFKIVFSTKTR